MVKEALAGLDKAAKVARGKYTEATGIGVYPVTLPASAKFEYAQLEAAIHRRYIIERCEIKVEGTVSKDDKGVWLTTAAGSKYQLKNRPKKDEKDTPPDVLAKIDELLKAGQANLRIDGDATTAKDKTTVVKLAAVEVVEKK